MKRLWIIFGLLAALTTEGCVTTPETKPAREQEQGEAPLTPEQIAAMRRHRLSASELSVWSSEAFTRQFAESYISATEIEPPLNNADEREKLIEIYQKLEPGEQEKKLLEESDEEKQLQEQIKQAKGGEVQQLREKLADLRAKREAEAGKIRAGRQAEAAAELREMQGPMANAVVDFTLGNIAFQNDELDEAAEAYKTAVKKYSPFRRAWKNLGIIHIRQGNMAEAIPALTRVIELGGGDGVTYGLLGFACLSEEQFMSAESAYRMAVLLDRKTMDWKLGLVEAMYKHGKFEETVALTEMLLRSNPGHAGLWMMQANAYLGQDRPMDAAENFEMVDSMGQSTVDSLRLLGDIYVNEGLFAHGVDTHIRAMQMAEREAQKKIAEAREKGESPDQVQLPKPGRPIAAARVVAARSAYEPAKRLAEAIQAVFHDRLSEGDERSLLQLLARFAVAEGDTEAEVGILKQMVENDPSDGEALILLGEYHTRLALKAAETRKAAKATEVDRNEALKDANQALEEAKAGNTDNIEALTEAVDAARSTLEQAQAAVEEAEAEENEQFARAVWYYERAEGLKKFEARALVQHAQLLVKLGKLDPAIPLLERAQEIEYRDDVQKYLEGVIRVNGRRRS